MNYAKLQEIEGDETFVIMFDEEGTEGLKYHDIT